MESSIYDDDDNDDNDDDDDYSATIKDIHKQSVLATIASLGVNQVLGAKPPAVAPSERRLTRLQRCTLSQLRSRYCHFMQDYLMRVGRADTAVCPECRFRRHSVSHLFSCDAASSRLCAPDLWNKPGGVTSFLQSLPSSFSSILPPDPPPPPSPPEPPPLAQ